MGSECWAQITITQVEDKIEMEKSQEVLPLRPSRHRFGFLQSAILVSVLASVIIYNHFGSFQQLAITSNQTDSSDSWCPLPDVVTPLDDSLLSSDHFDAPGVLEKQVERLSAAVKAPTESFDDNGEVDEDPRWETFDTFHAILESLFPLV